jgi:hypothetical protein
MSGKKGRSGRRPIGPVTKRISIQIRVDPQEEADLMAIAAHPLWAGEGGRDPKTPEVYRGLVAKELAELRAGRGGPLRVEGAEAAEG